MAQLKILVVEDEFLIAIDLEQILMDAGHDVCGIASTATDALRLADATQPQLAFLDVELLDGRTGFDIARHFTRAGMPLFVFITSHESELPVALQLGAGMIRKPYNPCDVVSTAAYFAQGILTPPPTLTPPPALRLSPALHRRFETPQ